MIYLQLTRCRVLLTRGFDMSRPLRDMKREVFDAARLKHHYVMYMHIDRLKMQDINVY